MTNLSFPVHVTEISYLVGQRRRKQGLPLWNG